MPNRFRITYLPARRQAADQRMARIETIEAAERIKKRLRQKTFPSGENPPVPVGKTHRTPVGVFPPKPPKHQWGFSHHYLEDL